MQTERERNHRNHVICSYLNGRCATCVTRLHIYRKKWIRPTTIVHLEIYMQNNILLIAWVHVSMCHMFFIPFHSNVRTVCALNYFYSIEFSVNCTFFFTKIFWFCLWLFDLKKKWWIYFLFFFLSLFQSISIGKSSLCLSYGAKLHINANTTFFVWIIFNQPSYQRDNNTNNQTNNTNGITTKKIINNNNSKMCHCSAAHLTSLDSNSNTHVLYAFK